MNRLAPSLTLALAAALSVGSPPASALISSTTTIDGPSAEVIDLGGVAMSEDGSGGIVYRKREGGRARVFAAQFADGQWRTPQRVDVGQSFDSYWPRIAAGDGGRLVVTWVHEFGGGSDRMFSASLDPGSSRFQPPVLVDINVGEASATYPSLSMNRGGSAYLAYRVLPSAAPDPSLPPGYVSADVRVARYTGALWSLLNFPADRNSAIPVRAPEAANSPRIGTDVAGNAVLAFHEPDDEFVDRVWARRVFGGSFGIPLIVSPQTYGEQPLRGPADQFSLDVARFGQGAVAFRQQPGEGSTLPGTRIFVNTIPEAFSDGAAAFTGSRLADGTAGDATPPAGPGPPSVGVTPSGSFLVAHGQDTATLAVGGSETEVRGGERLDDGTSSVPPDPLVDLAESGAAAAAWKTRSEGRGGVAVREIRDTGTAEVRTAAAGAGGTVNDLQLAGSGLGDALVVFQQGSDEQRQIAAAFVDAPPSDFLVFTPDDFVRGPRLRFSWDPAPSGIGRVHYSVIVDGNTVAERIAERRVTLTLNRFDEGRHKVEVVAEDSSGQERQGAEAEFGIDRVAPAVRVSRRGRRVAVTVKDGRKGSTSGVDRGRTRISFGAGRARRASRASFKYGRGGTFRLKVVARDRAGNTRTVRRKVRVR